MAQTISGIDLYEVVAESYEAHRREFASDLAKQKALPPIERFHSSTSLEKLNAMEHYSRCFIWNGAALENLKKAQRSGRLQRLLGRDRLSRDILRILCSQRGNMGERICGQLPSAHSSVKEGYYFEKNSVVTGKLIRERAGLLADMGLVTRLLGQGRNAYCLITEYKCALVLSQMPHGDYATCHIGIWVEPDNGLRKGITEMLSPFASEPERYKFLWPS